FGLVALGVLVAWGTEELTRLVYGPSGAPVLAAFVLAAVAQIQSRITGRLPAIVLVPGLLQLTPGFRGTEPVLHLLQPGASQVGDAARVPFVALQLVTGLITGSVLFRSRRDRELIAAKP